MKALHFVVALFISCATLAQTKQNYQNQLPSNEAIFQINDLDVERYNALFKAMERDGNFSILTACIPAHVIHIDWKNKSSNADSELKKFHQIAEQCGLFRINHMPLWEVSQFEEECLKARNTNKN